MGRGPLPRPQGFLPGNRKLRVSENILIPRFSQQSLPRFITYNQDPLSHSGRALRQMTLSKRPVFLSTAGLSPPRVTRASSSLAWEPHAEPSTPRVLGAESPQWRCLRGWELRAVLSPGSNSPQTLSDKAHYADDACPGVRGPLGLSQPCDSLRLEPCFASSPGSPSPASPDP